MIFIPSRKEQTKTKIFRRLTEPEKVYLPLDGYKTTANPVVNIGDAVKKHQLVAQSEGIFKTSIHSPVSGIVTSAKEIEGKHHLVIENDFKETTIAPHPKNADNLTEEEILRILSDYGIEGSGGARFPTHLKYRTGTKSIDTFIINGAECEPYLSADFALMKYEAEAILKTAKIINRVLKAKEIILAIEKQNRELKSVFEKLSASLNLPLRIQLLPDEYPRGGELQLIQSVTGKEIPKGSIPLNYGVVVSNVGTLWAIHRAVFEDLPYTERMMTISGENLSSAGNYWVKIGTPIQHILNEIGIQWNPEEQSVILGGPMMGKAVHHPEMPVHKGSGGLLILPVSKNNRYNCIQCGYCADVCPQHLMPMEFSRSVLAGNAARLNDYGLSNCIECGACAYICPSDVPLMSHIFKGKEMIAI